MPQNSATDKIRVSPFGKYLNYQKTFQNLRYFLKFKKLKFSFYFGILFFFQKN